MAAAEPSPTFAEACRQRNPEVRVEIAPAEALPFGDASFDAALAQLVVNFMRDAHAGLREMLRVTRPGGTLAAAVWDYAGEMTLLRRFWDAAVALDPLAEANDESRSMRFCTPDGLRQLWTTTGLADIDVGPVTVAAAYDGFEDLWQPLEVGVGPAGAYTVSLARDHRRALKDEVRRRLGVGEEPFELTARAWVVTGRVGPAAA